MYIASNAFENNKEIPQIYACDGKGINPQLTFTDVPTLAKSLVLIMDDPDAPMGTFVHWVIFNIPASVHAIKENTTPDAQFGKNSTGKTTYTPPCPPSGTHRYFFKLYALDRMLDISQDSDKAAVEYAMKGHIVAQAQLVGLYKKQ